MQLTVELANHEHVLALYFMCYNFCRIHQTLRVTPAMEAGVSDHVWSIEEIISLVSWARCWLRLKNEALFRRD